MQSPYNFIVKPKGERYNNSKDLGDSKTLITNTSIESFKHVNQEAVVVSIPLAYNTDIKKGDIVMVHHNVFRRFYDVRDNEKNSGSFFKEDLYFCTIDQIFAYKTTNKWVGFQDRVFVKPLKNTNIFSTLAQEKEKGVLKILNDYMKIPSLKKGSLIGFKPNREFEFIIDGDLYWCMKESDIIIKYEYKGNEEEYN
jgi:hypothetical protein